MTFLLNIGMAFWSLSFWLWSLAALASAFMLLRGYFLLSWLWHLPERMPKMRGSILLKPGDLEALNPPPKKLTAMQVGKMMLLVGAVLGAYDAGIQIEKTKQAVNYSKEYAAWKVRSANYQQAYAAWAARQPKETK